MTIADDYTELVLADELSAAAESVRGRDDRAHTFRRYADWCATRELIALPITEQNLLRFLHDHHPGWSWGYAKNLTSRLDAYARLGQQPSPRGPRVVGYLRRLKRELGTRPQQLVEACRVEEARRLTDVLHAPASDDAAAKILRVRAAIVIAAASGLNLAGTGRRQPRESDSPTFAADLTHAQLHVHADRVLIGLDPSLPLGVVHRGQDPLGFRLLTEHLAATADRRWPLLTEQPQPHRGLIRRVSSALVAAGLPAAARTSLAGLSRAERDWLLAHADRKVGATRRNHAYLLVGLGAALRHASLALLRLEDVTTIDGGYRILLRKSKTDQEGKGRVLEFLHDRAECDGGLCPACALQSHLEVLTRSQHRSHGPLFGICRNGRWRPMSDAYATLILKDLWTRAGLSADARIGTRSLRAGAATSASEAGWELWEIATRLTDHRHLGTAQQYIRRYDPWSNQFHLDV